MLAGLNEFVQRVDREETGCVTDIVRIKNGFKVSFYCCYVTFFVLSFFACVVDMLLSFF